MRITAMLTAVTCCVACEPELYVSAVTRLNRPPVPQDDSYLAAFQTPLAIGAADGVLANDYDPDGDTLIAIEGTPPESGSLSLGEDGGFIYTSNTGFVGLDTFTYRANDGSEEASAQVTVQVLPPDELPLAYASAAPLSGRAPLTVLLDGSGSSDDHGIASYAWTFGDGASGSGATVEHIYRAGGIFVAELTVTDDAGGTDSDTVSIEVAPALPTRSAWTMRDQSPGEDWTDSTWPAYTIRTLVRGASQTLTGTPAALLLRARGSGDYVVEHVTVARRDGATVNVDDTSVAQVTFGGTWDEPVTVTAGCPLLSDPIDFTLDGSDLFVTFWATGSVVYAGGSSGANTWATSTDESQTPDWQGLTFADNNANLYAVDTVALVGSLGLAAPILVSHWPLDEASGVRVDASGRGNDLAVSGTVGSAPGVTGDAADFDGASYLVIADGAQTGLDVASGLTVAAHIQPSTVAASHAVVAKLDNNGNQRSYLLRIDGGVLSATLSADGTNELNLAGTTPIAFDTWQHVALVLDPCADTVTLYLDGNIEATAAAGLDHLFDSTTDFSVGARLAGGAAEQFFEGRIDEVRLYTTPLSQAEIQEL